MLVSRLCSCFTTTAPPSSFLSTDLLKVGLPVPANSGVDPVLILVMPSIAALPHFVYVGEAVCPTPICRFLGLALCMDFLPMTVIVGSALPPEFLPVFRILTPTLAFSCVALILMGVVVLISLGQVFFSRLHYLTPSSLYTPPRYSSAELQSE